MCNPAEESEEMPVQETFPPIRVCIFDMDGLLIDSEDLYSKITNEVLKEYGKPDLPWSIKAQLQGRPTAEAYAVFQSWAQLPISQEEFLQKTRDLQAKYFPLSQPLPGVIELIKNLKASVSKPYIALATSSNSHSYALKTKHLAPQLFSLFDEELIVKGDDPRVPMGKGKPEPDIYLLALELCNKKRESEMKAAGAEEEEIIATRLSPRDSLVFEDSVPGVEAGRRAGMRVVWVPHEGLRRQYEGREDEVLAGLTDEGGEGGDNGTGLVIRRKGDGWGEVRGSLVGFDYHKYNIIPL